MGADAVFERGGRRPDALLLHVLKKVISSMPRWSLVLVCSGLFLLAVPALSGRSALAQIDERSGRQQIQAERFFTRGLTNARLGDYDTALRYYERALERSPAEASILSAMADAYNALDDEDTALFYAQQAVEHAPDNIHYYSQLASLHVEADQFEEAIAIYEQVLDRSPDDDETRHRLAPLYTQVGRYEPAIDLYEELLERSNNSATIYQRLLQLYVQTNNRQGAVEALEGLVETAPDAPSPRRMLVDFLLEEDDDAQRERAATLLEEVLELDPEDTDTAQRLAELYRELGRESEAEALLDRLSSADDPSASDLVEQARQLYRRSLQDQEVAEQAQHLLEQAIDLDPQHYDALEMLGKLHYQRAAYDQAARLLQRALEENPRDQRVWIQSAASFLEADDAEAAAQLAEEGLVLFPEQLPLVRIAAYAHLKADRTQAAIERFQQALSLSEKELDANPEQRSQYLALLGVLYQQEEDVRASEDAYEQAINLDPENAMALNNLAYSLAERGAELERAMDLAEAAVELDPENASYLDTLGWIHYRLGNYEEARRWIGQSIASGEASATVYEHYGDVLDKLGEHEQAREYWQEALEQDPNRRSIRERLE